MTKEQINALKIGNEFDDLIEKNIFNIRRENTLFYSRFIEDAFIIQRHLSEKGFWMELSSPFDKNEKWWAGFTPHSTSGWNGRPDYAAFGETAPEAICKAALMWKFKLLSSRDDR